MTGKQRAQFRAQANALQPEFQVGKGGMSEGLVKQTLDSFKTKELIKIKVLLETCPEKPKEVAEKLSAATESEVIQVIGGVMVLYKENPDLGKEKPKKKPSAKGKPLSKVRAKRVAAEKREALEKKQKRNFYTKKKDSV